MDKLKLIFLSVMFLSTGLFNDAYAVDMLGGSLTYSTHAVDAEFINGENITIEPGGSLFVDNKVDITGTLSIEKDFLHNDTDTNLEMAGFKNSGSFAFISNVAELSSDKLNVGGDFVNGDGTNPWDLTLNVDKINVVGTFTTNANSKLIINPDYTDNPSLTAGSIDITGGLYMCDSGASTDSMQIYSDSNDNVYTIITTGNLDVSGDIKTDKGKLNIDADSISVGGASLNGNSDWKLRLNHTGDGFGGYIGDLFSDGKINTTDDILIGGSVNGVLDITSTADMWVGEDLLGYWSIDVENLYVLGDVNGGGSISADTINIGGDLTGDINIDARELNVENVLGGAKFRPNLPGGIITGDAETQFHINPDTGLSSAFKQIDMTVSGTYFFDDDSYLQLVLNSTNVSGSSYDPDVDDALLKTGGFDASAVTGSPNYNDMDGTPNIEILVDNISDAIRKIRLIEITDPMGTIDLGMMNFAGVWFYWDTDLDGINDLRLFQESKLVAENNNIYAVLATMNSIEGLTRQANGVRKNDIQVASAIDDLILGRLRKYSGYSGDDMDEYYTAIMRILFPNSDVYYDIMLNGGSYNDAVDVMVSENPSYALNFVRGMGLGDVADIGNKLALSGRISRNAVSDQLMEDFVWTRYYDKNVGWLRIGIGDDITAFNFGGDAKINKDFIVGFSLGYNSVDFKALDGYTINLGLYGTYEWNKQVRMYANANLAIHSADARTDNKIIGRTTSDLSAVDTTLDIGILHKIFDTYVTGRGYLTFGHLGGYKFTQKYHGQDFIDIDADGEFILAPGYEVALGKDIWFSVTSFMRPSIKVGVEYNLLGDGTRDFDFKFSEVNNWRSWDSGSGDSLWWRYGAQIDFSFVVGTNISIGYEVLKNGDFDAKQIKLNGTYRF